MDNGLDSLSEDPAPSVASDYSNTMPGKFYTCPLNAFGNRRMDHVAAYPAPIPRTREESAEESPDGMDEDEVATNELLSDDDGDDNVDDDELDYQEIE